MIKLQCLNKMMMKSLNLEKANKEQIEAADFFQNIENNKIVEKYFSEEEKRQWKDLGKALDILKNAGIKFCLFPYLPTSNLNGNKSYNCWKFSSLLSQAFYEDSSERISEESKIEMREFVASLVHTLFSSIFSGGVTIQELIDFVVYCYNYNNTRMNKNE